MIRHDRLYLFRGLWGSLRDLRGLWALRGVWLYGCVYPPLPSAPLPFPAALPSSALLPCPCLPARPALPVSCPACPCPPLPYLPISPYPALLPCPYNPNCPQPAYPYPACPYQYRLYLFRFTKFGKSTDSIRSLDYEIYSMSPPP